MSNDRLGVALLTLSDSRDKTTDKSGDYLENAIVACGHALIDRQLLPDDLYSIRAVVSIWIAASEIDVVLTTGGTGFYSRDVTPEAVKVLFDKDIPGFGEVFRQISLGEIGMSTLQSRALAGIANRTAIFCLPGSTNACKTAWEKILKEQLDSRTKPCNFVPHLGQTPD